METAANVAILMIGLGAYGLGLVLGIRFAGRINPAPLWGTDSRLQMLSFRFWVWCIKVFVIIVIMLVVSALAWPILLLLDAVT